MVSKKVRTSGRTWGAPIQGRHKESRLRPVAVADAQRRVPPRVENSLGIPRVHIRLAVIGSSLGLCYRWSLLR